MNTKSKKDQKKQGQSTRQEFGKKKQAQNSLMHHEQESPETRMTR